MLSNIDQKTWDGFFKLLQLGRFLLPIVALLIVWELAVRGGWIAANVFPSPSLIFSRAVALIFSTGPEHGMLFENIGANLHREVASFLLSVLIAIQLGFLLVLLPAFYGWGGALFG